MKTYFFLSLITKKFGPLFTKLLYFEFWELGAAEPGASYKNRRLRNPVKNTLLNTLWQNIFFLMLYLCRFPIYPSINLFLNSYLQRMYLGISSTFIFCIYGLFSLPSLMYVHVFCNNNFFISFYLKMSFLLVIYFRTNPN